MPLPCPPRPRYKEAAKECTSALELQPSSLRALQRRAKAYELQGLYSKALSDVAVINKSDSSTPETQEAEMRLRDLASKRPASAATGGGASAANGGAALARPPGGAKGMGGPNQGVFTTKCSLGDETKMVHLTLSSNYADLMGAVAAKFPNAGVHANA